jgi:hypothetical protein
VLVGAPSIANALAWQWVFLIVSGLVFTGILALVAPQSVDPADNVKHFSLF